MKKKFWLQGRFELALHMEILQLSGLIRKNEKMNLKKLLQEQALLV